MTEDEFIKSTAEFWQKDDVYNAWHQIYKYTGADWVKYVLDTIKVEVTSDKLLLTEEDRSRDLRRRIEQQILDIEESDNIPSLNQLRSKLRDCLQRLAVRDQDSQLVDSCLRCMIHIGADVEGLISKYLKVQEPRDQALQRLAELKDSGAG